MTMWIYVAFAAGAVVLVAVSIWQVSHGIAKRDRELHALPRTMIGELVVGARVRVVGRAYALGDTTVAPLSGKRCLAYDSKTFLEDDDRHLGRKSHQVLPFQVADESGAIGLAFDFVTLELALLVPDREGPQLSTFGEGVLQRESGTGGVDHFEGVLEPEQKVAVIGTVEHGPDGALRLAGTAQQPLVISTDHAAFLK